MSTLSTNESSQAGPEKLCMSQPDEHKMNSLAQLLHDNLNFKTTFFDEVLNELKEESKTLPTQTMLEKLNKLRVEYMNDYPTPTTHHMEKVELSHIFNDIISKFVKANGENTLEQWWVDAVKNTVVIDYGYKYLPATWENPKEQ